VLNTNAVQMSRIPPAHGECAGASGNPLVDEGSQPESWHTHSAAVHTCDFEAQCPFSGFPCAEESCPHIDPGSLTA
jgi:hypothetical protein